MAAQTDRGRARLGSPWALVGCVTAAAGLVAVARRPLADPDLSWHLLAGREIVRRHTVHDLGATWSLQAVDAGWTTTQWLSEVLLLGVSGLGGFRAFLVLDLLVAAVLLGLLARLLLRSAGGPWPAVVFALTAPQLLLAVQPRPQLASLLLLVWLAGAVAPVLTGGRPPVPWRWATITWLWANLHGLWVMVPGVLLLLTVGALLERRGDAARRLAATTAACLAAACLTPVGPALLLSPWRFAAATGHLAEWQPVVPRSASALLFDLTVVLLVATWTQLPHRVPTAELVLAAGLIGFGLLAYRNLAVASLLLSPLLLRRLQGSFPTGPRQDSAREQRMLARTGALVLLVGGGAACALVASGPVLSPTLPDGLARLLAAEAVPHRVLNDYDAGGTLLWRGTPAVQVAVDGRADRYGAALLDPYVDLLALRPGFRSTLAALAPDRAVLRDSTPLAGLLQDEGWRRQAHQDGWLLLTPPVGPPTGVR